MNEILSKIVHKKYDVPNSLSAREKIYEVRTDPDEELVSFDIVALFPSIPMDIVFDTLEEQWPKIRKHTKMSFILFKRIMKFILVNSTYLTFDGNVYKQTNGCAMGVNISPTIANLITNRIFDSIVPKLSFRLKLLLKYVDDILALVPKNHVDEFLTALNSFHNRIQFTCERETNGKLAYLDLLVMRVDDGTIITDWHQKPTASGRILNYVSNHKWQQKANVAFNLFNRALSLSDECFHTENINRVFQILLNNGYPKNVIRNQLFRAQRALVPMGHRDQTDVNINTSEQSVYRRSMTYTRGLSEPIAKVISSSIEGIKFCYKPCQQLLSTVLTKIKDKTPMTEKTVTVCIKFHALGHSRMVILAHKAMLAKH